MVRREGIGLGSRRAVALLGLATASRFRLLAKHRSGVRFPARADCLARTKQKISFIKKLTELIFSKVRREGIEPTTVSLKGSCSTD